MSVRTRTAHRPSDRGAGDLHGAHWRVGVEVGLRGLGGEWEVRK